MPEICSLQMHAVRNALECLCLHRMRRLRHGSRLLVLVLVAWLIIAIGLLSRQPREGILHLSFHKENHCASKGQSGSSCKRHETQEVTTVQCLLLDHCGQLTFLFAVVFLQMTRRNSCELKFCKQSYLAVCPYYRRVSCTSSIAA